MAMEPALTQFESSYKKKINLVSMNVDQDSSPEYKKYGHYLVDLSKGSIPLTVWSDARGKVLDQFLGGLSVKELAARTEKALKLAR